MIIYNMFEMGYHLVASFTDLDEAKKFLVSEDAQRVVWVGVYKANEKAKAVPMWVWNDFIDNYPHKS